MGKVSVKTEFAAPADQVWNLVKGFNDLPKWHPAFTNSELKGKGLGSTRTLTLPNGGKIVERLDEFDDGKRRYSYSIEESPLPLASYRSTIEVKPSGKGCELQWSSEYQTKDAPAMDMDKFLQDFYQAGFDNVKKILGLSSP